MLFLEPLLLKIATLQEEVSDLKEKLSVDSKNSSKPPSADFKNSKKKKATSRKKSNKKQGAQPGHKGVNRQLEPVENINHLVESLDAIWREMNIARAA